MILIKIDSSKVKEYCKKIDTSNGNYKSISSRLQLWINANLTHPDIIIARDIKNILRKILIATPNELELIINDYYSNGYQLRIFNPALGRNGDLTAFGKIIRDIFNYKSFRQSKKAIWLSNSLSIKSCTTCNTQYTLKTNQTSGEKLLFHLDHYFPKSVYPYLSLSYYNLIPCCASCNMSKSNKPFTLRDNIHPYIDSFHDIAKFKIDNSSLADFLVDPNKNEEKITYNVEIRAKYFGNKIYETKLENYLREFRINEQYVQFKDLAAETYLKSKYYEKARRKELKSFFDGSGIHISDELIKRFILGNYHQDKDLLKRPLAKFMKDIGEDLNLV
jgi:hypothetical protein